MWPPDPACPPFKHPAPTHTFLNLGPRKGKRRPWLPPLGLEGVGGGLGKDGRAVEGGGWQRVEAEIGVKVTEPEQNFSPAWLFQISSSRSMLPVPQAPTTAPPQTLRLNNLRGEEFSPRCGVGMETEVAPKRNKLCDGFLLLTAPGLNLGRGHWGGGMY